MVQSDMPEVTI